MQDEDKDMCYLYELAYKYFKRKVFDEGIPMCIFSQ